MMKKGIAVIAVIMLAMTAMGCNSSKPVSESEPTLALTPTIIEPTLAEEVVVPVSKEYSIEALTKLAESLTEGILQGEFEPINSCFTQDLKSTYTADVLQEAFSSAIKPLGEFIAVNSVDTQETEDAIYIAVILKYENNGLLITYGFDSSSSLITFYFNYKDIEEEVISDLYTEYEITVGDANEPLDGLLTLPTGVENPPVVILVHGSGQNDMDETIGAVSNKPFRDLAHGLAEQGIASIRYNKRYYQYADSIPEDMTISDEVLKDVSAAITLAKEHSEVDSSRIYVLGHSLGGILSPKIALDNDAVVGIISMAGSPRYLEDIIYDQVVHHANLDVESSEDEKALQLESVQANVERVKTLSEDDLSEPILGCTGYYWKSLHEIDTKAIVANLEIPMLFLQGSADFQIYADIDFAMWKEILEGHKNASFIEYEGLNHLFMPTTGVGDTSDYDTKANVSDKVILDIADWINKQ
jgi:dienelactone hydrolase